MKINRWYLPVSSLWLLAGCQSTPPLQTKVQIARVMSGQSVEFIDRSQQPPVIQQGRLAGIDAPDLAQEPWGKQAKQRLEELLKTANKDDSILLELDRAEPDKYGRKFIYLWKDGRSINEQLVKEGCVLVNLRKPSNNSDTSGTKYRDRLIRSSQYARLMGVGIWNPTQPMRMSPAEFRKEER
jgi:micrococcal nuclease